MSARTPVTHLTRLRRLAVGVAAVALTGLSLWGATPARADAPFLVDVDQLGAGPRQLLIQGCSDLTAKGSVVAEIEQDGQIVQTVTAPATATSAPFTAPKGDYSINAYCLDYNAEGSLAESHSEVPSLEIADGQPDPVTACLGKQFTATATGLVPGRTYAGWLELTSGASYDGWNLAPATVAADGVLTVKATAGPHVPAGTYRMVYTYEESGWKQAHWQVTLRDCSTTPGPGTSSSAPTVMAPHPSTGTRPSALPSTGA